MENLNKLVRGRVNALEESDKSFSSIFHVMFSTPEYILGEWNDGYKISSITYGEAKKKIMNLAYSLEVLYPTVKDTYIALAMDSNLEWILSYWAILASGNKPYLVNLRHPKSLVVSILKTLNVSYALGMSDLGYGVPVILYSELNLEGASTRAFANEMALSTSATTLKEKIIFYSGKEISAQILNVNYALKQSKQIKKHYHARLKLLVFLPLYHIFGFMATYMWFSYFGRTLVFLKDYSSTTILRTIRKHEVTHVFAVPLFWNTVEKEIWKSVKAKGMEKKFSKGLATTLKLQKVFPNLGLTWSKKLMHQVTDELFGKSIQLCISGGSYIKDETLRLFNGLGYPLYNGYGMSEIGITSVELGNVKDRLKNSVGKPFPSVSYKLENGELLVSGDSISHKLMINGELVENTGAYPTMDLAREDSTGRFYILGRKDDLFIGPNGENINPDEMEKEFTFDGATRFSILELENRLSMIVEISKFTPKAKLLEMYKEIQRINDLEPTACRIQKIYFTYDPLQAETAIKVSRQYVNYKLKQKEITLLEPKDVLDKEENVEVNPEILAKVIELMKESLGKEDIIPEGNFFFDYGGSSLEYFSFISMVNSQFGISISFENEKNYPTAFDLAKEVERLLCL